MSPSCSVVTAARALLGLASLLLSLGAALVLALGLWLALDSAGLQTRLTYRTTDTNMDTELHSGDLTKILKNFVDPAVSDNVAYILIILGSFIFITSFLGYCGFTKEPRLPLTILGICSVLGLCVEAGLVVAASQLDLWHPLARRPDTAGLGWVETVKNAHCCGLGEDNARHLYQCIAANLACYDRAHAALNLLVAAGAVLAAAQLLAAVLSFYLGGAAARRSYKLSLSGSTGSIIELLD